VALCGAGAAAGDRARQRLEATVGTACYVPSSHALERQPRFISLAFEISLTEDPVAEDELSPEKALCLGTMRDDITYRILGCRDSPLITRSF
jgi:hypothetical protein